MRLIGYIRVSEKDKDKVAHSPETQRAQILRAAEGFGHEVVAIYEDLSVSGGKAIDGREGGRQVMESIRNGDADGVIIQRLDRMFRLGVDGIVTGTWFRERGKTVISATEGIDIKTKDGWFMFFIKVAQAEHDRLTITERAKETAEALRSRARTYGGVPFGCVEEPLYDADGKKAGGKLWRIPQEWSMRETIVRWKSNEGLSFRALADRLWELGIRSPRGGKRWSISTLRNIVISHHDLEGIPALEESKEPPVSLPGIQCPYGGSE